MSQRDLASVLFAVLGVFIAITGVPQLIFSIGVVDGRSGRSQTITRSPSSSARSPVSLLFPRPIMFYFGRYFMAGPDEHRREIFNERWYNPMVRRAHRLVTLTWGVVYVGEFVLRVSLIYRLSPASVLALAPLLTGLATIGTILWTFWYAYRVRSRLDLAKTGAA